VTATPSRLSLGQPTWPAADGQPAPTTWDDAVVRFGPEGAAVRAPGGFAVSMPLADGRWFLAIDRFAERTLCWSLVPGDGFRVAERADALGAATLQTQAVFEYLYFHAIPSPRTAWDGVQRLPPGHCAVFDGGRVDVKPYWRADFTRRAGGSQPSFEQWKSRFLEALQGAVASRLDGSTPACFLSGGTDSSTVAGMMMRSAGRAVTYSIGFDAAGYDEMAYARIAAKHFGAEHREYYVTPDDLVARIPEVAAFHDQPFGNSSALPAYCCALRAREDGVTRLLAGDGGDELFGGNSRYAMQRIYGWYEGIPAFVRRGLMEPFFGLASVARTPILKKGSSYIRDAKVPLPDRLQHYNLLRRLGFADVLEPGFLAAISSEAPLAQQREVWRAAKADHAIDRMLAYDWRYTLAESDLPKVNGSTRLAGVEVAYPMLDEKLLDIALDLPPDYKLKGLKLRWFFKEALKDFLPPEIIVKQKKGFGLPFGVWATRHAGLKALALESLHGVATRGVVRPAFVKDLVEQRLPEHPGYYGEMVWILMMFEQWLRHHAPDWKFQP
jgi:asparagine synthase (glutamine-hydrolysing)